MKKMAAKIAVWLAITVACFLAIPLVLGGAIRAFG